MKYIYKSLIFAVLAASSGMAAQAQEISFVQNRNARDQINWPSHRTVPVVGDWNGDGFMDVYYGGTSCANGWQTRGVIGWGNAGGTFTGDFEAKYEDYEDQQPIQQKNEDGSPKFDENGTPLYETDENGEYIYETVIKQRMVGMMNGTPLSAYGVASQTLDFNQDGRLDLLVQNTWGSINWTEYSMNAITAGWWTDGLYQYNDPDGLPMVGKGDQLYCSMGENRARITNGIAAGMVLMADNFSTGNASGNGNPELSRTRAKTLLCNPDVNAMLAIGRSFYPVYGYDEYQGHSDSAESFAMYRTDSCLYVSVINYGATDMAGTVPFERLGLDASVTSVTPVSCIKELWKGDITDTCSPSSQPDALSYNVPAKDARIYRITLADDTSIRRPFSDGAAGCSGEGADVFDLLGRPMTDTSAPHGTLTITRQRATDGTARTTKQLK